MVVASAHRTRRSARPPLLLAAALLALPGCDRSAPAPPQASAARGAAPAERSPADRTGSFEGFRWRLTHARAGAPLPDAVLTDPEGTEARLAIRAGRPLLVNLWASWCAPCIAELPALAALARDRAPRLDVVALSLDGERRAAAAFLAERGLSELPLWHDRDGTLLGLAGAGLPTTILYDGSGREVWRVVGGFDWRGAEAAALLDAATASDARAATDP